jgi:hypothetical protein
MRHILLGAMMGTLSLSATAATDESVYDYLINRSDAPRAEIIQDEADLIAEMRETSQRASREEIAALRAELAAKEREVDFAKYVQSNVRGGFSSRTDWEKSFSAADIDQLRTTISQIDLEALSLKDKETKEISSREFPSSKDIPFKVVRHVSIEKRADGDHRISVNYSVALNTSIPRNEWPASLRRRFEKLDNSEIEKFLENEINNSLESEKYLIGKYEDLKDSTQLDRRLSSLSKDLATHAASKVFGAARSSALNTAANNRIEKLGSKNKELSEIWDLNEQIGRESDDRARRERLEDLRAKLEIAKALRANPKLAENKEPCAVILGILGNERFKKLSRQSQMDCDAHLKKEEERLAEERKNRETDSQAQQETNQQALEYHNRLLSLAQHCMTRAQQMAQQSATRPIDNLIRPLLNALQARGAGCTYFGMMMGDISRDSLGINDDAFNANLFGANPFLMEGMNDSEYSSKAKEVVDRATPKSAAGTAALEEQRSCLLKMNSLAGMSLQQLTTMSPSGDLPPELLGDPQIQQMLKFHGASTALLTAVQEELDTRGSSGAGGVRALASESGEAARPVSLGNTTGGSRTPVRVRSTDSTQAERGLPSGTNNRTGTDSSSGAGAPRSAPPPNFFGD